MREKFEETAQAYDAAAAAIAIPADLSALVVAMLDQHRDLRWDDAVRLVLNEAAIERVRADKDKAKKKSGDFTGPDERG